MEDLQHLPRELVRGILQRAVDVEAGCADPEHVANQQGLDVQGNHSGGGNPPTDFNGRV